MSYVCLLQFFKDWVPVHLSVFHQFALQIAESCVIVERGCQNSAATIYLYQLEFHYDAYVHLSFRHRQILSAFPATSPKSFHICSLWMTSATLSRVNLDEEFNSSIWFILLVFFFLRVVFHSISNTFRNCYASTSVIQHLVSGIYETSAKQQPLWCTCPPYDVMSTSMYVLESNN